MNTKKCVCIYIYIYVHIHMCMVRARGSARTLVLEVKLSAGPDACLEPREYKRTAACKISRGSGFRGLGFSQKKGDPNIEPNILYVVLIMLTVKR